MDAPRKRGVNSKATTKEYSGMRSPRESALLLNTAVPKKMQQYSTSKNRKQNNVASILRRTIRHPVGPSTHTGIGWWGIQLLYHSSANVSNERALGTQPRADREG